MTILSGILSLAAIVCATALWLSVWRPTTLSEVLPASFLFLTSQIILLGYLLSHFNSLGKAGDWLAGCSAFLLLALGTRLLAAKRGGESGVNMAWGVLSPRRLLSELSSWSRLEKLVVLPPLLSTLLLLALGLVVIGITVPHESDSLSYHLARVAYYYQHGNTHFFEANYWAMVVHPTNPAILMLYTFVASGKNESLLPLAQWTAYAISIASVYGIARRLGCSRPWSLLAASLFALLPDALLESTAAENDLILTAYTACAALLLMEFMRSSRARSLALAGASAALALGVKSSAALCLPALAVLAIFAVVQARKTARARVVPWLVALVLGFSLAVAAFDLPAGYMDNWRRFGNPVGPPSVVSSHSYAGAKPLEAAKDGALNLLRYGFDFLSLDGLKLRPVGQFQEWARRPLVDACVIYGLFLDRPTGSRLAFSFYRKPEAHEDFTYWGILGFGLLWVAVALAALGKTRSTPAIWFAWSALVFLFSQSFLASYDYWRGRYFITGGVFACPVVACVLAQAGRRFRSYAVALVLLGCLSAWSGFFIRNSFILRSGHSLLHPDRLRQMLADNPQLIKPFGEFDRLVPADATVAVAAPPDSCEYALFEPKFQRRLLPINSFLRGELPIPPGAQYFMYKRDHPYQPGTDFNLGADWYLRKLP